MKSYTFPFISKKFVNIKLINMNKGLFYFEVWTGTFAVQGPVVQSSVSLTSSLRGQFVKCFMTV